MASDESKKDNRRRIIKLWIIGLGICVLFFFYQLLSMPDDPSFEGRFDLRIGNLWMLALQQSFGVFFLILFFLLVATVAGVDRLIKLGKSFFPFGQELNLQPFDGRISSRDGGEILDQDIGIKLFLDYHESIKRAYSYTIQQYSWSFIISLVFAALGMAVIFYAVLFRANANPNWPSVVVSAIIQSVPALFFYLSDRTRSRMTQAMKELREDHKKARAYELLNSIKDDHEREDLIIQIVRHSLLDQEQGSSPRQKPRTKLRAGQEGEERQLSIANVPKQ
ncbi:MAG TPA: hypothetical protein VE262_22705 [Blastocatellia bacterium]|nr:hypothetical protein [Blastocatellia bacterium]